MVKFFNTTGLCKPEDHYMVEPYRGYFNEIYRLIESQQYFLLHAPRQTGKTTFLHAMVRRLNAEGKYIALVCSLESAGLQSISVEEANRVFVKSVFQAADWQLPSGERPPHYDGYQKGASLFNQYLSDWAKQQAKPIVLLLDEVDALFDDVLVSVLRQLRDGFQSRPKHFPSSIAIVGLRDIRDYKSKVRGDGSVLSGGSPFNINTKSFFLPVFSREEARSLLDQHTAETGQVFSPEVFEKIYEFGGGQPWLTNALANEIVREMLDDDFSKQISLDMVEEAKENLIVKRQTHLYNLTDKLREPRIRQIVTTIINGDTLLQDDFDESIRYGRDLGIVRVFEGGVVRFANPIYREIITRVMSSSMEHSMVEDDIYKTVWYLRPDGSLDMDKLLREFQKFYRENAEHWLHRFEYEEAGQQLLLMAFLQRIVNGGGRIEREMAAGRGRTDLSIFWKQQVFVIEMKLKRSPQSRSKGISQTARYCDTLGLKHGYLVLFELKPSETIPWEQRIRWDHEEHEGKQITVVEM
ncbi:MAG: AAA-like domain-containing protein [Saprospiraceae bacterium]